VYFATPPVRTHREKADYLRSRGHLLELGYDIHLSTTVLHRLVADSSNARWAASTKRAQRYHKGYYFTGDGARRDADGYYGITGRVDDVLNVSGHRIGTAEIESALVLHPSVAEAAVVGYPHEVKAKVFVPTSH